MRMWYILLWICVAAMPTAAAEAPDKALVGIQRAVDSNDPVLLEKYLDVGGVITKGVDEFIADFASNPPGGEGDPLLEMLSGGLAAGRETQAAQSMRLLLIEETRKFVVWGVASGNFSGQPSRSKNQPNGGILSALFADASTARKELRSVRCDSPKADTATATARMYDHGSERSYPLQIRLKRQQQGHWKVTEVSNMTELIRMVRREAEAR